MITVHWWVLPAVFFAGTGVGTIVIAIFRARGDAALAVLAETLARPAPAPAAPQLWQAPVPPWADPPPAPPAWDGDTSWRGFGARTDGSEFAGENTVSFRAIGFPMPEPELVDEEPTPSPRERFVEPEPPAPPIMKTITTTVGDRTLVDTVEVQS